MRHCDVVIGIGGRGQLRPAAGTARRSISQRLALLPGSACDVGGDDIGGVPVQAAPGPVISHRGSGVGMGGCFLDVAQRYSGIQLAAMNACRSVWGVTVLPIPARRAALRTIRPARSRRLSHTWRRQPRNARMHASSAPDTPAMADDAKPVPAFADRSK